jgi:hypothetical protein
MGKNMAIFEKWNACESGHCVLEKAHPLVRKNYRM